MTHPKSLIVIPTFNEADNIQPLVEKLLPYEVDVMVVDDNSPDGTSDLVRELTQKHPGRVHLISRQSGKNGRGSATLEGFEWALARDYALIFEMDADFSHDPAELPRFFDKIKDVDVVVASRYRPNSQIVNWPLGRRIFSRCANLIAKSFLRLPLSDFTNGYRCYRREALESINAQNIPEKGYIVLSYIAAQMGAAGHSFDEVHTRFVNRKRGTSQLSFSEVFGAVRGILRLRSYVKRNGK